MPAWRIHAWKSLRELRPPMVMLACRLGSTLVTGVPFCREFLSICLLMAAPFLVPMLVGYYRPATQRFFVLPKYVGRLDNKTQ